VTSAVLMTPAAVTHQVGAKKRLNNILQCIAKFDLVAVLSCAVGKATVAGTSVTPCGRKLS
jgi:hypothetical protein